MNLFYDEDTMIKVLIAKLDTMESQKKMFLSYASVVVKVKQSAGVKVKPYSMLIYPKSENANPNEIEKKLQKNLKPKDLKVGIFHMKKISKDIPITTKKLKLTIIEAAIKENDRLKDLPH